MNINEYKENKKIIEDEILNLRLKLAKLAETYIEENKVFSEGDRVYSEREKCFGIVEGNKIYFDKIIPVVKKEKKDGTVSKLYLHVGKSEDLTLAPK